MKLNTLARLDKVTCLLLAATSLMISACGSAPPRYEGNMIPQVEVAEISRIQHTEGSLAGVYEWKVKVKISAENKFGFIENIEEGTISVRSNDTEPVELKGKVHLLAVHAACKTESCDKYAVIAKATRYVFPEELAPSGEENYPKAQVAALFEERDGEVYELETVETDGQYVNAADAF